MEQKTVIVGMSGGVDSSVAAYLLKKQGYRVIGVTMQIWQEEETAENGCCGLSAVEDARRAADDLGIPFYVMNFRKEFRETVIDYFVEEYLKGHTPNPCIACNRYVKWEALLNKSLSLGADFIATGHYAQIDQLSNGRFALKKSVTAQKDQTYALYNLTQKQLSHTLMPVGAYTKEEIRKTAEEIGLLVAQKKDSQEICFIPDHDYAAFIKKHTKSEILPGNFVRADGIVLGRHKGLIHYTIGQRKGLNLSLGSPAFVTEIRPQTNEVVIGTGEEVYGDRLYANRLNFMAVPEIEGEMEVFAKIRYSHKGAYCKIRKTDPDQIECKFYEPQRAITPGQAVVFYQGDYVLGGGTIIG